MSAATDKPTPTIPGAENLPHERETALHRVQGYPVVKDLLSTTDSYVQGHPYIASLVARVEALSHAILARLEPLQRRLPLDQVDQYANATLDYLEKKVPHVKMETGELVSQARKPADAAYGLAQDYKNGFQQRFGPYADPVYQRLHEGQTALSGLQERLASTVKQFPHDQASLNQTLESLKTELDTYVKAAQSIPAHAQASAKPYVEKANEVRNDIQKEILRKDIPVGTKASNVLHYSQEQLTPVLEYFKGFILKKKDEAAKEADTAKEKVTTNGSS
ncbi:hypothetical protein Rhopal_001905-T1 [Rhodotorula paludigena]|uniref:Uncharacterized protein n=1 Tax=Rhodotorula paludigena TaxID=86838 RepID=A0AAV5GGD0_9BASI|nr:hypothetical protein Rhopal_001905-T1 [Rhodotorula paludigena]